MLQKTYFDYEPSLLTIEGDMARVCFDVEHTTEQRIPIGGEEPETVEVIKAYSVRLHQPVTRPRVIDAIITAAYPQDEMQAVVNNYLVNTDDPGRSEEFNAMQEWRSHAKQIAADVMDIVNG